MSEIFREALQRYMAGDDGWDQLVSRTRAIGQAAGITSEEDLERLFDQYRREKKQSG